MSKPPPFHPIRAPRRFTVLAILYGLLATGLLGLYSFAFAAGWERSPAQRGVIPQSVRQSPGGYRSYFFIHGGYQGGK